LDEGTYHFLTVVSPKGWHRTLKTNRNTTDPEEIREAKKQEETAAILIKKPNNKYSIL
jgi:hypothetical protein